MFKETKPQLVQNPCEVCSRLHPDIFSFCDLKMRLKSEYLRVLFT